MPRARALLGVTMGLDGRIYAISGTNGADAEVCGGNVCPNVYVYSVSGAPGLNVSIAAPDHLDIVGGQYAPNPFDVLVTISNSGTAAATNIAATLSLPPGLSLATETSLVRPVGVLAPGEQRVVAWSVRAAGQRQGAVLSYFVGVTSATAGGRQALKQLSLPGGALGLTSIVPNVAGDNGLVTVTIHGGGLPPSASARLVRAGQPDVVSDLVKVAGDGKSLIARFDLRGRARGEWDVIVSAAAGTQGPAALARALSVQEGRRADLHISVISPPVARVGRPYKSYIVLENRGNVDVQRQPFVVYTSDGGAVSFDPAPRQLPLTPTLGLPESLDPLITITPGESDKLDQIIRDKTGASAAVRAGVLIAPTIPPQQASFITVTKSNATLVGDFIGAEVLPCVSDPLDPVIAALADDCLNSLLGLTFTLIQEAVIPTACISITVSIYQKMADIIDHETFDNRLITIGGKAAYIGMAMEAVECAGEAAMIVAPETKVAVAVIKVWKAAAFGVKVVELSGEGAKVIDRCKPLYTAVRSAFGLTRGLGSRDPNDKFGLPGSGDQRYVASGGSLSYAVAFENVPSANAAAQEVIITDQLDVGKLDLTSFSLGLMNFGATQIIPPPGLRQYAADVDLRPANNLIVRVNASLDSDSGVVTWRFISLGPGTLLPTEDPEAGFLPPNQLPPQGEGSVLFTVLPKAGLATGTEIRNKARIVFDVNEPIDTPEWLNTIDATKPQSQVTLPVFVAPPGPTFPVNWSGADGGSGILDYTIYVSENSGPFTMWQGNTTATTAHFTGQPGKTYAFYSVARDQVGNLEDAPPTPDATIQVLGDAVPPTTTASLAPVPNLAGWNSADVTVALTTSDNPGGSGVAATYYAIDNAACAPNALASCLAYTRAFVVSPEGAHTVTFFSRDNAGNFEALKSQAVRIDRTPPATNAIPSVAPQSNGWYRPGTTIALVAIDPLSGVERTEYNFDNTGWLPYTTPIAVSAGAHTLRYRSVDVAGNQEPERTLLPPDLTVATVVEETGPNVAGQTVHILNTVRNLGGSMAANERVFLVDRLPAGTVYRSSTGAGVSCTHTSPDVACERAGLAAGESFTVRIEVQLPPRSPGGGTHLNQVEVDPKNDVGESNESNNRAQVSIPVR
jgi:uncharacterized repeat protein (TIGR01451 family)